MSKAMTEPSSLWHELLEKKINRRGLVKGAMMAGAATAAAPIQLRNAQAAALDAPASQAGARRDPSLPFSPIQPSTEDAVVLPAGYRQNTLATWGDDIGAGSVGFNHDWIGFFPVDGPDKGFDTAAVAYGFLKPAMSGTDGLLVINHEYVNPMFVSDYTGEGEKTPEQIAKEQDAVGMSIVRVSRDAKSGEWAVIEDSANRRITAVTPTVLTGPAAEIDGGPEAIGTVANCSGGMTPWGTALSCEENFQDYPAEAPAGYGWPADTYGKKHYGWVVEVDPYDPESTPRKHTAMGRFRHENVALRVAEDGTVVAYMGDDRADACVYKFVSDAKYDPAGRENNLGLLESGRLYVADFGNGRWLLLDYASSDALKEAKDSTDQPLFKSQADVLADARAAALAVRATPVDRPEDIEISPKDGSVFIALTNNTGHGNFHGQIVRLVETDGNPAAETFDWSIFAVGGPQSGFSSPDNLVFDGDGNLWMVTDVSSSRLNKGIYTFHGNNGMFFFRTAGPYAGIAYQFASAPNQSELTGPAWTPDGRTLFLSVQHPGEESASAEELSSHWPKGGSEIPRSAVVAIQGFRARKA
jgi:secreted PhoX family phosphatase